MEKDQKIKVNRAYPRLMIVRSKFFLANVRTDQGLTNMEYQSGILIPVPSTAPQVCSYSK